MTTQSPAVQVPTWPSQKSARGPPPPPVCALVHPPLSTAATGSSRPQIGHVPSGLGAFAQAVLPRPAFLHSRNILLSIGLTNSLSSLGLGGSASHVTSPMKPWFLTLPPNPPAEGSHRSPCFSLPSRVVDFVIKVLFLCCLKDAADPELCVGEDWVCLGPNLAPSTAHIPHWTGSVDIR